MAKGEGSYIVGSREYAVHKGDLIIINAGIMHGEAPFRKNSIETYCCTLSGIKLKNFSTGELIKREQKALLHLDDYSDYLDSIANVMFTICNLYEKSKDNFKICEQLAISALMMVEKILLKRVDNNKFYKEQKNEDLIRSIINYLDTHYTQPISLDEISKAVHISKFYLLRLFKKETGISPIQYIVYRRIGEAQSLLMERI